MTSTTNDSIQLPTSSGDSQLAQQLEGLSLDDEKVDYLSALPNELIRRIFTLAYAEKNALRIPLNKRLLPFQYEQSFGAICVYFGGCMRPFMDAVASSSRVGGFVAHLIVVGNEDEGHCAGDAPEIKALHRFCRKLTNLRQLIVTKADTFARLVLKPAFAQKCFPSLSALTIAGSLQNWQAPFRPSHYRALELYSNLARFDLGIERNSRTIRPSLPPPSAAEASHFAKITRLSLAGTKLDKNAVLAILHASTSVREIVLSQHKSEINLPALLRRLPNPQILTSLELFDANCNETASRTDLSHALSPFSSLTHVRFFGPYDTELPSFYAFLRTLPLVKLDIGPDMPLSASSILASLEPSTRHPSLKILALSNIMAVRGPKTDPDDWEDVYLDKETGEPELPPGWFPPLWVEGWTSAVVRQIAEAAGRAGVKVEGATFEAEAIEEEYGAEEAKIEMYYEALEELAAMEMECGGWDEERYEDSGESLHGRSDEEEEDDDE
ncbi:hypothetical protein JCM10207_008511 [Rhodosporidiobolus poonsookiae]